MPQMLRRRRCKLVRFYAMTLFISYILLTKHTDDESDSDYSGSEYAKEDTAAASDRRADPLIKERLENLYDTENITALVHRFMQHASIITTPDTPQQDLTHLMAVMAGLFNSLMIRWSSRRDVILNILLYHRWASVHAPLHIVHLLWQAWSMSENAAMVSGDIMDNMSSAVKSVVGKNCSI